MFSQEGVVLHKKKSNRGRPRKILTEEERMEKERERKISNAARSRYRRSMATPEEIAKRRALDAACKRASRQMLNDSEVNMNSGKYRAIRPKMEIQDEVFDPAEFVSCEINDESVEPTEFIVCDAAD